MNEHRRWWEILNELHEEAHRDGYFGRKPNLEHIVDELLAEMEYAQVVHHEVTGLSPEHPTYCRFTPPNKDIGDK